MEFEDGEEEVLEGAQAEVWRQSVDRALTLNTLRELDDREADESLPSTLWEFLEDVGETGLTVLLYFYRGMAPRGVTTEDVAGEISLPLDDVEEALEKLRSWGFLEEYADEE